MKIAFEGVRLYGLEDLWWIDRSEQQLSERILNRKEWWSDGAISDFGLTFLAIVDSTLYLTKEGISVLGDEFDARY